jgi:hypothetical protein
MSTFTVTVTYIGNLEYEIEAEDAGSAANVALAKCQEEGAEDIAEAAEADEVETRAEDGEIEYFPADLLETWTGL